MRLFARLRMLFARRPWILWSCVMAIALIVATSVRGSQAELQGARDRWGSTVPVFIATRTIAPGDQLEGAVARRLVPSAMAAPTALAELPLGATAQQSIAGGETVTSSDVSVESGPAALLPKDWLGVAIDTSDPTVFRVGDSAVVLAGGQTIGPSALVVSVIERGVVVGVPATVAAAVADAAQQHTAVVAISASPPPR